MKLHFLIFFFLFNLSICYYSLKLNKVYLKNMPNHIKNKNLGNNKINDEYNEYLKNNDDFPLNYTELKKIKESFIPTENINSEIYTIESYLGSDRQYFKLLLSTFDDLITVSSINCKLCNASNKYDSFLSKTVMKLKSSNENNKNHKIEYEYFKDLCSIPLESIQNDIIIKKYINISSLNFKVVEKDSSGFLNSNLVDGILGLSYNKGDGILSKSFISQLYDEGYLSSLSFSIIITSSNINRFYLGDIMENDYIRNYYNSSVNKGECSIIDNNWKCKLEKLEYNALKFLNHQRQIFWANSNVSFNIKENKLIIPKKYYSLIVRSYKMVRNSKTYIRHREYNKFCTLFNEVIYCICSDKDDFGIVTFHFGNNSKLDIDLRGYISYDSSAMFYKCRTDIILSDNNEFVVGLRGLNNAILSFNIEEKKIKFFHKIKRINFFLTEIILILGLFLFFIGNYLIIVFIL